MFALLGIVRILSIDSSGIVTLPIMMFPYGTLIDWVLGVTTMFGPYLSISFPTWICIAAETVNVETMTAIARIKPMELMIERPFRLERFFETKVNVRKPKPPSLYG